MARPIKPMNARKQSWAREINANQHEILMFTPEEIEELIDSRPSHEHERLKKYWQEYKSTPKFAADYGAAFVDSVALKRLFWDLGGFPKGAKIKVVEKITRGQRFVIISGYAGLRKRLTGTRYLAANPKVVQMGLGRLGARNAIVSGGKLTIIALAAFRFIDYLLTDEQTLAFLIGTFATDVVKAGAAMAASWGAVIVAGKVGLTLAIGPLAVAVIFGFFAGYILSDLDERHQLTAKLVNSIEVLALRLESGAQNWKAFFENLPENADQLATGILDYAMETAKQAGIRWVEHHINKVIPKFPRFL